MVIVFRCWKTLVSLGCTNTIVKWLVLRKGRSQCYLFWAVCYTIERLIGLFLFEIPSKWKNPSSALIERRHPRVYEIHHKDKMVVKHLFLYANPILVGWHIWYEPEYIPYSRFSFPYFMIKNGKRQAILIHLLFLNRLHNWKVEIPDSDQSEYSGEHDDVIKWKHFPRYWSFVRGIHRSRWIPRTKASDTEPWCFLSSTPE